MRPWWRRSIVHGLVSMPGWREVVISAARWVGSTAKSSWWWLTFPWRRGMRPVWRMRPMWWIATHVKWIRTADLWWREKAIVPFRRVVELASRGRVAVAAAWRIATRLPGGRVGIMTVPYWRDEMVLSFLGLLLGKLGCLILMSSGRWSVRLRMIPHSRFLLGSGWISSLTKKKQRLRFHLNQVLYRNYRNMYSVDVNSAS